MENPVIHIDIRKALRSREGVMNLEVQADVPFGKVTALFGSSGAGKTTLVRLLAGLAKPDSGSIRFGAETWFDAASGIDVPPQRRNVGVVFQDYALFPNMTVEENILFAQAERDASFTLMLLDMLELRGLAGRKPSQLSGGQMQRAALARALARRPRLLLLDEPLSALDAGMRVALQEQIAKAHERFGATTLLVSHDLHEVFRLASHIVRIDQGRVTATGAPEEVFSESRVSGKFQVTGQISTIERRDVVNLVTVITANNTMVRVIAFDDDIRRLAPGDHVLVVSKAFNPILLKL